MSGGKVLAVLRLLRVGTLFSPAADVTASLAILGLPRNAVGGRAVAASVSLYAAGMVWNDIADRRLDAVHRPERPLPSGELPMPIAIVIGTALLLAGLTISPCPIYHGVIAALILAYDFALKRIDWLGVLGMGTLRGLNLATALVLIDVDQPAGNALLVASVCYGLYICAVTALGIYEDRPNVRPRAVASVQAVPPLAALCGLFAVQGGLWPAPAIAILPVLWFARRNARIRVFDQATIRRSMMFLLLGTMLYTSLLALAAGHWIEASAIALAVVPARLIARRIALT